MHRREEIPDACQTKREEETERMEETKRVEEPERLEEAEGEETEKTEEPERVEEPEGEAETETSEEPERMEEAEREEKTGMNQVQIGEFIAKCRREKELTQAQLAEKLNITDRAVSKWETGKCMPDSAIMLELCGILGITVNELLSGEKVSMENVENYQKKAEKNLIELKRRDENNLSKNMVVTILFSAAFLIGIAVCAICDLAISGTFTWSLIPISSIIFAWVVSFPVTLLGKRGIVGGLAALSIFLFLYLYILSELVGVRAVFSIGAAVSVVSVLYLWLIFGIFRRMKGRNMKALGITLLVSIPFTLAINVTLSRMIGEPLVDVWDILSVFILLIAAFSVFVCDYAKNRGLIR